MTLTNEDRIWNRALDLSPDHLGDGDRALAALLLVHGLVMNGGVEHAIEVLTAEQLRAAAAAYRYLAFEPIALLLEQTSKNRSFDADGADRRYWAVIPDDNTIEEHFRSVLSSSPAAFSPLEG